MRLDNLKLDKWLGPVGLGVAEAILVLLLAERHGLWPVAALAVLIYELRGLWRKKLNEMVPIALDRTVVVLVGLSAVMIIATSPRLVTQLVAAVLYGLWRATIGYEKAEGRFGLTNLLVTQIAIFEAIFLIAAIWQPIEWLIIGLVWATAYISVFSVLNARKEPTAGVMAAVWALVCAEISWVLVRWLFIYMLPGGYLMVPQPVVVLGALGYCFGSIYVAQRKGSLSRGRLTEYLLIGLILIAIVVIGTPWRGTL